MRQKWEMEEHCILSALQYSFHVTPYKPSHLFKFDQLRSQILKQILHLPRDTCTDLLFLPATSLGCEFRSLIPPYVQMAGQSLITSLADKGRLGAITRARASYHIRNNRTKRDVKPSLACPLPCWKTYQVHATTLRRAAWVADYGMHISTPNSTYSLPAHAGDIKENLSDCIRLYTIKMTTHDLYDQILVPLWDQNILYLHQLIVNSPQSNTSQTGPVL